MDEKYLFIVVTFRLWNNQRNSTIKLGMFEQNYVFFA